MNERLDTYIKKSGEGIFLTAEERTRMQRTIHSYMDMKPIRMHAPSPSKWNWTSFLSVRPMMAAVLLVFVSSAGVSYAAQHALPGDPLYAIKTGVNEPVSLALSFSSSAKADLAMRIAGTRIEEAATLAAAGHLDPKTQDELVANFEQNAAIVHVAIAMEASSSAVTSVEAATSFETQLSEYQRVLTQVAKIKNTDVRALATSIDTQRNSVGNLRGQAENPKSDSTSSTRTRVARARAEVGAQLNITQTLANDTADSISTSSARNIASTLENAHAIVSAADESTETLDALKGALKASEKIRVFLKTSASIHAHTGLVMDESEAPETSSEEALQRKPPVPVKHYGGSGESTSAGASTLISTTATSSDTEHTAAATTGVSENTAASTTTRIIVPLSVPVLPLP